MCDAKCGPQWMGSGVMMQCENLPLLFPLCPLWVGCGLWAAAVETKLLQSDDSDGINGTELPNSAGGRVNCWVESVPGQSSPTK